MKNHTVQQGECLATIAIQYGFLSWKTIYDAPENADLRKKRPNPNVIYPGDEIVIPEKAQKESTGATQTKHKFEVRSDRWAFRIEMRDDEHNPLERMPFELHMDNGNIVRGQSRAQGLIDVPIPAGVRSGKLHFGGEVLQLDFADLDPITRITGIQARLNNLGYRAGPVDGIAGPQTRRAVSRFQKRERLSVSSGEITEETRRRLLEVHDADTRLTPAEDDLSSREYTPAAVQEPEPAAEQPTEGWTDEVSAGTDESCIDDTCAPRAKQPQYIYFAIYYRVPDRAFQQAAETWQHDVEHRLLFDQSASLFVMKEVTTESEFKKAWEDIAEQARNANATIREGVVFSHASKGEKSDGLEFKRNKVDDGTLTLADIQGLPVLNWQNKPPFGGGLLVLTGCNSGLRGDRGWSPAEVFAKAQGITTVGQAGFATFSIRWEYEVTNYDIASGDRPTYLWAYASGRNNWKRPLGDGAPRMAGVMYYPGEKPFVGITEDYDPQFGLVQHWEAAAEN